MVVFVLFLVWLVGEKVMVIEVGLVFFVEVLFMFIFVWVVLNMVMLKDIVGNLFYGFVIGVIVFVGVVIVGLILGGGFNLVVVLGLLVSGYFVWSLLWFYIVVLVVGVVIVVFLFCLFNMDDVKKIVVVE